MARPKKDSQTAGARERIIEAFWSLIEETPMRSVTVAMVAERARCNRGTFYYHFEDMDALVYAAITDLLFSNGTVLNAVFVLSAGATDELMRLDPTYVQRIRRFSLIAVSGEMHTVDSAVKLVFMDMWRAVLCPDGGELEPDAQLIIASMTGMVLSMVRGTAGLEQQACPPTPATRDYLTASAKNALRCLCRAQGISEADAIERLQAMQGLCPAELSAPRREA